VPGFSLFMWDGAGWLAGKSWSLVLELLVEVAGGAGNVDAAGDAAFAVLDALDDAGGLLALGAIGALGGVHHLVTACNFGNLSHGSFLLVPRVGIRVR
jgi:hypothetical protein